MLLDYVTGLMAGYVRKELSSRIGITGLYIIILVGCVYMIEISVLKSNGVFGDGVVIAYSVIEFLSIVEMAESSGCRSDATGADGNAPGLWLRYLSGVYQKVESHHFLNMSLKNMIQRWENQCLMRE
ncbi:phage holin family protein [Paenibacillus elgii]|uniref:phage holin family protein n=1 Tax=Paenibacillus elgii TaxID=189691 RepID=UPI001EF84A22|nr:phage holin family protein [Paenibacillus elgii]